MGHAGGEQYLPGSKIKKTTKCAIPLLIGCSSGTLQNCGDFEPHGNVLNYLVAGWYVLHLLNSVTPFAFFHTNHRCSSPSIAGNLWDVTDKDIDRFSKTMLSHWGIQLEAGSRDSDPGTSQVPGGSALNGTATARTPRTRSKPSVASSLPSRSSTSSRLSVSSTAKSLVRAVAESRDACILKYLNGAAPVVYGIPCYLTNK